VPWPWCTPVDPHLAELPRVGVALTQSSRQGWCRCAGVEAAAGVSATAPRLLLGVGLGGEEGLELNVSVRVRVRVGVRVRGRVGVEVGVGPRVRARVGEGVWGLLGWGAAEGGLLGQRHGPPRQLARIVKPDTTSPRIFTPGTPNTQHYS